MADRDLFGNVDFLAGTVEVNGKKYLLRDKYFPTVDSNDPSKLSDAEKELMTILINSFGHSGKLRKHIRFLLSKGATYKVCNGNLLFHGCIPMDSFGELMCVNIGEKSFCGRALLDEINLMVNRAYFTRDDSADYERDFMWYLWCGAGSPLYGKDKLAFFEQYFIGEEECGREYYNDYYKYVEDSEVCKKILRHFSINEERGHIINGHVPVKIKDGESPVKADGKLFVIDGGISKAYQKTTGIAGYTLIYDSHSLSLAEHKPFVPGDSGETPTIRIVEKLGSRANISDTDKGAELLERIEDLNELLRAYRNGDIKENSD